MEEVQLTGGIANAGAVTRRGDEVLRPSNAHSPSIHRFLSSLRGAGFDGAPEPLGFEEDGRERLVFVEGEVPLPRRFPAWSQSDDTLASVARLMRRFHEASRAFDPSGSTWSREMADPAGGPMVCHNDVCLENVVFRDGAAVALLDFDFAAPGRPVYDVAAMGRMCVPVDDDVNAATLGWQPADRPARLRLLAETYGLEQAERHALVEILTDSIDHGGEFILRRLEAGDPNFTKEWHEIGGMRRFDRRREWWAEHAEQFRRALD